MQQHLVLLVLSLSFFVELYAKKNQYLSTEMAKALENYSALFQAVRAGNLKLVETLLSQPNFLTNAAYKGCKLLHVSAGLGHIDVTRILLEKGASPRAIDVCHQLPLHHACINQHLNVAHLLVQSDPQTINHKDRFGMTALMLASERGDLAGICMLLENGAKLNICDMRGQIPLNFAARSGNVESLEFMLQVADASSVEKWISDSSFWLKRPESLSSLTCCAIDSGNIECLKVLVSSKLPKRLLQMSFGENLRNSRKVHSPLTYLLLTCKFGDEKLDAFLQVLLNHKLTMVCNWMNTTHKELQHPFSFIIVDDLPPSQKQHYFNLFSANDITIDYCLQGYNDNSKAFSSFTNYVKFYHPLWEALNKGDMAFIKLMISDSAILEPDQLFAQLIKPLCNAHANLPMLRLVLPDLYSYLISLKPIYYLKRKRSPNLRLYLPFSPQEEFSKSTLKQLCRTCIRHQLRDYTLDDNLRNFKRKIMELPLPSLLKNYLLFKNWATIP